jgi:serine/threonine protein kinase
MTAMLSATKHLGLLKTNRCFAALSMTAYVLIIDFKRHIVEIGQVLSDRYRLERLIKQGRVCAVFQGRDIVLHRTVAIKAVPAHHAAAYRAAIRMTCHFSHPNIIGLYDLVVEPEGLYIIQEYVDGEDFSTLMQVSPYHVADFGGQLCQALLYASSSQRPVSHGDLNPSAVLLDRQGTVRVNNFALPADPDYFENWSVLGSEGVIVSDVDLPCGQFSEGRQADDTRAVGLLLYQLLAGHPAGATQVDPPVDGQLHFPRSTPAELCETIARAVIRSHPHQINTIEALNSALRSVVDTLEPAMTAQASMAVQPEEVKARQFVPVGQAEVEDLRGVGKLVSALPVRDSKDTGFRSAAYWPESSANSLMDPTHSAPTTLADVPFKLAVARQAAYQQLESQTRRSPILLFLLLGLVVFALFFVVGYFTGHFLFFH